MLPDEAYRAGALVRQSELTKPPGSLGRLEELATTLAALQRRDRPRVDTVAIDLYAADHGVVAEGVSAFPQAVTGQMLANFANGGAAISVLARSLNATLRVFELGLAVPVDSLPGVIRKHIAPGTAKVRSHRALKQIRRQLDGHGGIP